MKKFSKPVGKALSVLFPYYPDLVLDVIRGKTRVTKRGLCRVIKTLPKTKAHQRVVKALS
jgi:hypothetical protein